ncbi:MAG: MFS transporter [Methanobrevibacter sp.]
MESRKFITVVLTTTIASFIVAYTSVVPALALPSIAKTFNLNNFMQNWVINAFLFSVAIFAVPTGNLAGKWGLKKSFLLGNIIFLIGAVITSFAFSPMSLILFRAFQGVGAALIYNTVMNIVAVAIPEENRGKAIGIVVAGVNLGLVLAPTLGGVLTYNLGWESIFLFTVPFLLLIIPITYFVISEEWKIGENDRFDIRGGILWMITIFLLIYGFTSINHIDGIVMLISGIFLLVLWNYLELRVKNPVYDVKVFKDKRFKYANLSSFLIYIGSYFVTYVLSYHLQYILGWNSEMAGLLLMVTPIIQIVISPYMGRLSDKTNPLKIASLGIILIVFSLVTLDFLIRLPDSLVIIVLSMIFLGVGMGVYTSPNTNVIMSSVKPEDTPTASVSVTIIRVIGQSTSSSLLIIIFTMIMGSVEIIPKYYGLLSLSIHWTCIIGTILCIFALFASLIGYKYSLNMKNP